MYELRSRERVVRSAKNFAILLITERRDLVRIIQKSCYAWTINWWGWFDSEWCLFIRGDCSFHFNHLESCFCICTTSSLFQWKSFICSFFNVYWCLYFYCRVICHSSRMWTLNWWFNNRYYNCCLRNLSPGYFCKYDRS